MIGLVADTSKVEEIVPILLNMLLKHDLITDEQANQIWHSMFKEAPLNCLIKSDCNNEELIML